MKRRLFALLLSFALLLTLLSQLAPQVSAEEYSGTCGAEGDNLLWSFDPESGTLTITGSGAMITGPGVYPWESYRGEIIHVNLPDGLTTIGNYAFYHCSSLKEITLPDTLIDIGFSAFSESGLEQVTIPSSVRRIRENAFRWTPLADPNGSNWQDNGFYLDDWLIEGRAAKLTVKPGTHWIADRPFSYCETYLEEVVLPDSLKEIPSDCFCTCKKVTSITIPSSVTAISDDAFACSGVISVTIPDSVLSIGNQAFDGCSNLCEMTIPSCVQRIGRRAFFDCASLNSIVILSPSVEFGDEAVGYYGHEVSTSTSTEFIIDKQDGFTIIGYEGSSTETYASDNGFEFISLGSNLNPFTDVNSGSWYYRAVMWAISQDPPITAGTTPTTFAPNKTVTRAEAVTFLWAAFHKPAPETVDSPFSDVSENSWFCKPVLWAVENGITSGIGENRFGPGSTCTRGQIVTFLWAAAGKPEPETTSCSFSDVSENDWFYKPVLWAVENNITAGIGGGKFGPGSACTRAQVMTFLWAAMGNQ